MMGDIPDGVDSTEFISNQLTQVVMEVNESKGKEEEIPCLEDIPDMDDEELSEEEEDESGGGDQVVEEEDQATLSTLPTSRFVHSPPPPFRSSLERGGTDDE